MSAKVIKVGEFVVLQKHNYKRLHKLNKPNNTVSLGRDNVNLAGIAGCPYFSIFKMVPSGKKGREYRLELTDGVVALRDEIDIKTSGTDNRNIIDDGRSQKLTYSEIAELTNDAGKASDIVETLISNSNTFHDKTEFSQEKYLKKKEKKYFEYLQVLKPNLRLIAEIMYKLDPNKIQCLRIDTLSQIMTMSNIQSEGTHLLYDSGSNGLVPAALLSLIGERTEGKLVHMHPGNMCQKQALQAMNFAEEHLDRCISVNIYSVLRQIYQGCDTNNGKLGQLGEVIGSNDTTTSTKQPLSNGEDEKPLKRKAEDEVDQNSKIPRLDNLENNLDVKKTNITSSKESNSNEEAQESIPAESDVSSTTEMPPPKKPKWHFDNIKAAELLTEKVDSLVIVCKESPLNVFNELMQFVRPGRPFVVYYPVAEPLQHMFVELKTNPHVAMLKLTCDWMRNYQVLPDRTHPEVSMNSQSGFLLTGYILK